MCVTHGIFSPLGSLFLALWETAVRKVKLSIRFIHQQDCDGLVLSFVAQHK